MSTTDVRQGVVSEYELTALVDALAVLRAEVDATRRQAGRVVDRVERLVASYEPDRRSRSSSSS